MSGVQSGGWQPCCDDDFIDDEKDDDNDDDDESDSETDCKTSEIV